MIDRVLSIRKLDTAMKFRLRARAAVQARTVEDAAPDHLGSAVHALFQPLGGVDIPEIVREPVRESPRFDC